MNKQRLAPLSLATISFVLSFAVVAVAGKTPTSPLSGYVTKTGEVRSFEPDKISEFRTAASVRRFASSISVSQIKRYEAEGFVEAVAARLHDPAEPAAEGVLSAFRFKTQAGAIQELKAVSAEEHEDLEKIVSKSPRLFRLRRLRLAGLHDATALALEADHAAREVGIRIGMARGHVALGRCLISMNVYRPDDGKRVAALVVTAIRRISKRTYPVCL